MINVLFYSTTINLKIQLKPVYETGKVHSKLQVSAVCKNAKKKKIKSEMYDYMGGKLDLFFYLIDFLQFFVSSRRSEYSLKPYEEWKLSRYPKKATE